MIPASMDFIYLATWATVIPFYQPVECYHSTSETAIQPEALNNKQQVRSREKLF